MAMFQFKSAFRMLYPVRVLVVGLAAAQAVATAVVWRSNHALFEKLTALALAGYAHLPGMNIDPSLTSFEAAFSGGIFFTASLGAGIVLLSLGAVVLAQSFRARRTRVLLALLLIAVWVAAVVAANADGICPDVSVFLLLLPPVTLAAALAWSPYRRDRRRLPWRKTWHLACILVLLAIWAPRIDQDLFVNIKDNLMLTTRPGIGMVHLYYKYTLYPAEVFKPLAGRQVKTFVFRDMEPAAAAGLEKDLNQYNYFAVRDAAVADLLISGSAQAVELSRDGKTVMTVPAVDFHQKSGEILGDFSQRTDNARVFRRLTLWSLVWVAPLVIYLSVFAVFCLVPGLLLDLRASSVAVPLLCCLFFAFVVLDWLDTPAVQVADRRAVTQMLKSGTRREKIAALRYVYDNRLEISGFAGFAKLLSTDDYAQRYWLVRNLGNSRHPDAMGQVLRFMQSDSSYMVCKAIEAAAVMHGGTVEREVFREALVSKLQSSTDWYVQHYAFSAARRTGWVPETSD